MINLIKQLREERGMSQNELAKKVGISRTAVSQIELNNYECRLRTALKISIVLNKPIEEIFYLEMED